MAGFWISTQHLAISILSSIHTTDSKSRAIRPCMEATALSVGKSVLSGALGYAKSALAEEVALQLGIQRDHAFVRDELEMMLALLMAAHDERDENKVVKTWVKQVRDVAYDAEDSLDDFAVRLGKQSWWRIFRTLLDRHRVAKQMKELRAKVEDVSQRNVRYRLIKGSDTKPATGTGQSSMMTGETMSGMEEARREKDKAKADLIRLINKMDENLQVIAIWGPSYVLQEASIIKLAYDDLKRRKKFECHALIQIMHPFNPTEFLKNIVRQFYVDSLEETESTTQQDSTSGAQDLRRMGIMTEGDLVDAFNEYLNQKRYLIVLTDVSNVEEWDQIKAFFPSNNKGSRLIVCAQQVEVASLCVGPEIAVPEHKLLSSNQVLHAFYEKGTQGGTDSMGESSISNTTDTINSKSISEGKGLTRTETMLAAFKESQLIGRENEKKGIINMISNCHSQEVEVISICGMGGLGKTTLVKHVYQSQKLNAMFAKRACVTIKRPFNPSELIGSLAAQLGDKQDADGDRLSVLLQGKRYLIILDDVSSTTEWDAIEKYFPRSVTTSKIIVTTREENICKHCSKKERNIHKLELLRDQDAQNLFTEKVFGTITYLEEKYPELVDETKLILKKCNGLPLAIVTMSGFLAKQPKTLMEWRKFNEHISAELEMNTELQRIPNVLIKSYEGLTYHLKSCFLYLSIFPEDYNISRRRLVRRWTAEGYSSEVRDKSSEEIADSYFMELIDRSMILPVRKQIPSRKGIGSCQLHDLMREISISRAMDENLVFRLEEGSRSSNNTQDKIRHVAISSNWEGDKCEFESAVDLSHLRSLTVFGKWRSFFISDKMSLLRVLDLEGTRGLLDHHLEHIGRLVHLKYISLRGCSDIFHLPDSWGNLRQLQTLDMKGTCICKLPKAIMELTNLQYLFAGDGSPVCVFPNERLPHNLAKLCGACFAPKLLEDVEALDGDLNWHDVCSFWCHVVFPTLASRRLNPFGILVPRGVRKLKALRTLGLVNIAGSGKAVLRDIRKLTQLRKLAVAGINRKNYEELCSTLAELSRLESLSVKSIDESSLHHRCCLDGVFSPPKNLQSLKLEGTLVKLPEWIGRLQSLSKLVLDSTKLTEVDATMQVLGKLPNLAILRLVRSLFNVREFGLTFHQEAFPSLVVLHITNGRVIDVGVIGERLIDAWVLQRRIDKLESVEFEVGATPRLELLVLEHAVHHTRSISGLSSLSSLKKVMIRGPCSEELMRSVRDQISRNTNNPVLKR